MAKVRGQGSEVTIAEREAFLERLRYGHSIRAACAGLFALQTYYNTCDRDPEFAQQAEDAISDGFRKLEAVVTEAASAGDSKLALESLARRDPNTWARVDRVQHAGADGGPLKFLVRLDEGEGDDDDLDEGD